MRYLYVSYTALEQSSQRQVFGGQVMTSQKFPSALVMVNYIKRVQWDILQSSIILTGIFEFKNKEDAECFVGKSIGESDLVERQMETADNWTDEHKRNYFRLQAQKAEREAERLMREITKLNHCDSEFEKLEAENKQLKKRLAEAAKEIESLIDSRQRACDALKLVAKKKSE